MQRYFRWAPAAILMVACLGSPAAAWEQAETPPQTPPQQPQQPQQARDNRRDGHDRRPWWKDPGFMAEIGLTSDQSTQIDGIFKAEVEKMKPKREHVTELERALDEAMRSNTADIDAFARQVQKIEAKRAELNTMRTVMLYRMRRVLTTQQNAKFQAMWDRREAARNKESGRR